MITTKQTELMLDQLDNLGITAFTLSTYNTEYEYKLHSDDRDWVTFHKSEYAPAICDKLEICNYQTTQKPVYKDWYMTVNYHS
ncbi:hypothetical protein NVP1101O_142 [Vibrio phage 1.101.O._10N.261.45.C6]|nr:hypothetical protein NVP1101O_142 [Vibrio phage 1.101.O._10N.261.45.C6]